MVQFKIAIKPTGWTHKENGENSSVTEGYCVEKKSKNTVIFGKHKFTVFFINSVIFFKGKC